MQVHVTAMVVGDNGIELMHYNRGEAVPIADDMEGAVLNAVALVGDLCTEAADRIGEQAKGHVKVAGDAQEILDNLKREAERGE